MEKSFAHTFVHIVGTFVFVTAIFCITMAGLNLMGQTHITNRVIKKMDTVLGI